jgi:hypothetical protein
MDQMVNIGKWQDRWVEHPFPNMGEPKKAMCYLTDIQGYDQDHLAWLYNKASLHAINRFFMQVLHAGSKEIIAIRETDQQFGELGPPLVWLWPLQTGYGWQIAGYLPRLL